MHTSPNKIFEGTVYPHYSRRINQAALKLSGWLGVRDGLFNETMLPTGPRVPARRVRARDAHQRTHRAETPHRGRSATALRCATTEFWEPPSKGGYFDSRRLNVELAVLDFLRFLRPLSQYPPLNRFFCNHIWMTAERLP